jgi:hypothetical protein
VPAILRLFGAQPEFASIITCRPPDGKLYTDVFGIDNQWDPNITFECGGEISDVIFNLCRCYIAVGLVKLTIEVVMLV